MSNLNPCCSIWYRIAKSVEVRALDFNDAHEKQMAEIQTKILQTMAKMQTKILRYSLGTYCPTCGNKLEDNNE